MGAWLKINGASVYGTHAGPVAKLPWGRCTAKVTAEGSHLLYLHVFEWPAGGTLNVPGLATRVKHARLLAGGAPVVATTTDAGLVLKLPAAAPDPIASVVAVELEEEPRLR